MKDLTITLTISLEDIKRYAEVSTDKEALSIYEEGLTGLESLVDDAYQTWLDNIDMYKTEEA